MFVELDQGTDTAARRVWQFDGYDGLPRLGDRSGSGKSLIPPQGVHGLAEQVREETRDFSSVSGMTILGGVTDGHDREKLVVGAFPV